MKQRTKQYKKNKHEIYVPFFLIGFPFFLDASTHLYMRVCPSVVPSVGPAFFKRGNRVKIRRLPRPGAGIGNFRFWALLTHPARPAGWRPFPVFPVPVSQSYFLTFFLHFYSKKNVFKGEKSLVFMICVIFFSFYIYMRPRISTWGSVRPSTHHFIIVILSDNF